MQQQPPRHISVAHLTPPGTASLATVARELAQDLQLGRVGASPTPCLSQSDRFQVESGELGDAEKMCDLQIGRSPVDITASTTDLCEDMLMHPVYSVYNTYDQYVDTYDTFQGDNGDHHDRGMKTILCPPFPAGIIRFVLHDDEDTKVGQMDWCCQINVWDLIGFKFK